MSIQSTRERLSQTDALKNIQRTMSPIEMVTVHLEEVSGSSSHGIYCALIPSEEIEHSLTHADWDLGHGEGLPSIMEYYQNGDRSFKYRRFGRDDGIEPLVIDRNFYGVRESYVEINEEFRLFHHLHHDRKQNRYTKIDENGEENVVAVVEPNQVKIRLKELRQFLAAKGMYLSIQFDYVERAAHTMEELELDKGEDGRRDDLCYWSLHYDQDAPKGVLSRLLGKRLIEPFPKLGGGPLGSSGEQEKYEDFIIGVDDNGNEITYTCDPQALANPDAPSFLTPVSFQRQVLDRYYRQPSKYEVSDSYLGCGGLWGIDIDNHHDDKVYVWLGDLGHLPYKEQLHWKAHNIASATGISETYRRRQLLGQWANSSHPEHVFLQRYQELQEVCKRNLGWQILLPLEPDDQYHLRGFHVPTTDEQPDFDRFMQGLSTILVDSLHVKQLKALVPKAQHPDKDTKSIAWLETALATCGVSSATEHIAFLRDLQNLRSAGSAHRKGGRYNQIKRSLGEKGPRQVCTEFIGHAIAFLDYLIELVQDGRLSLGRS